MASIPDCALACLGAAIANSTCSFEDAACQCTNTDLNNQASDCILSTCTVREALTTLNITNVQCGVTPHVDHKHIPPLIAFIALAASAVVLRLIARVVTKNHFWWDDLCNMLAALVCFTFFGVSVYITDLGIGTDIWAISFDDLTALNSVAFSIIILYATCRFLIRTSIILFYIRIFRTTTAIRILWATFFLNIVVFVPFFWVTIFQCKPISYFWLQWDGQHQGECIDPNNFVLASAIIDLVEDVWLLALPLAYIIRLRLPWKQKWPAAVMFAVGIWTLVLSIIRVPTTTKFSVTALTNTDSIPVILWSGLELDVGLFCACLPTIYPLLRQLTSDVKKHCSRDRSKTGHSAPYSSSSYNSLGSRPHVGFQAPGPLTLPAGVHGSGGGGEITVTASMTQEEEYLTRRHEQPPPVPPPPRPIRYPGPGGEQEGDFAGGRGRGFLGNDIEMGTVQTRVTGPGGGSTGMF